MENTKIKSLANGGDVGAPALGPEATQAVAPPAPGGEEEMMGMLEQYSQTRDAEIAVQIADMLLVEMGLDQGDQAPSVEEPPVSPPPLAGGAPEGVPAFSKGGQISAIAQFELNKKK
jgi:hypothetical protein